MQQRQVLTSYPPHIPPPPPSTHTAHIVVIAQILSYHKYSYCASLYLLHKLLVIIHIVIAQFFSYCTNSYLCTNHTRSVFPVSGRGPDSSRAKGPPRHADLRNARAHSKHSRHA